MTLEQIDQALAQWQERLALAGTNLLELDDIAAYQRLRGDVSHPAVALTGLTHTRIGPALPAISSLWQSLQQLTEIIQKAQRLRASLGRLWVHEGERRQIEFLLQGESVQMPSVEAPFAQRGLLSGADQTPAMTPERLLAQMTQDFVVAKEAVLALETAWSRLDQSLVTADREVASLQSLVDRLGAPVPPEMDAARREVASLRARVSTDPLGVEAALTAEVTSLLARARAPLSVLEKQRTRLETDLGRARVLLQELDTLQPTWETLRRDCRDKIEAFPVTGPVVRADFADWLRSVEEARQRQQWKPARIGLDRWLAAAEAARGELSECCLAARAALERRQELRGLLHALQAKARAQAAQGRAPDLSLADLAREAQQLLHGRPTPLERAASVVAEYERRLLAQ